MSKIVNPRIQPLVRFAAETNGDPCTLVTVTSEALSVAVVDMQVALCSYAELHLLRSPTWLVMLLPAHSPRYATNSRRRCPW
jgi:hypothetical protein